jgi:hypothetical protein
MTAIQLEQLDANTAARLLHSICPRLSEPEACSSEMALAVVETALDIDREASLHLILLRFR